MKHDTEIEYRLRWSKVGHRTRFYAKRAFAEKAAAKYREKGFDVQLDSRIVSVVRGWEPADGQPEPAPRATAPALAEEPATSNFTEQAMSAMIERPEGYTWPVSRGNGTMQEAATHGLVSWDDERDLWVRSSLLAGG